MGGSSKVTVGWKHFLGVHFVPCMGPVDYLYEVAVDKRIALAGRLGAGDHEIDQPDLFGGKRREGGIQGTLAVLFGGASQTANEYLTTAIGEDQPAYRGVVSAVFEQGYIGNNPYLKPWSFRMQRIFATDAGYGGGDQWYPEKAAILQREVADPVRRSRIYLALDASLSMNEIASNGQSRLANMKTAITAYLNQKRAEGAASRTNSFRIVAWNLTAFQSITRTNAADADYDALIAFVQGITTGAYTNFEAAVSQAEDFFGVVLPTSGNLINLSLFPSSDEQRQLLFLTDGEPTGGVAEAVAIVEGLSQVEVYGYNIDLADTSSTALLDNTPDDGVPVISGGDPAALTEALFPGRAEYDMNPAHIVREVLISPDTGGSGDAAEIDPVSFASAADRLYTENFGLSIEWSTPSLRAAFLSRLEEIVDATIYMDRRTGLWKIYLIRDDEIESDIFTFNKSNVISWDNISRPELHTLPNSLVLTWTDPAKDEQASRTLTNPARVQQIGRVRPTKREYPEVNTASLAAKLARRDLLAASSALLSGQIVATYAPLNLHRGKRIVLNNPDLGIVDVIARITEMDDGDGRDNSVRISFLEDKFSLSDVALDGFEEVPVAKPAILSPDPRLVEEQSYYQLAREQSQEAVDAILLDDPDIGFLHVAAGAPSGDSLSIEINTDAGAGYGDAGAAEFVPSVRIWSDLSSRADHVKIVAAYDPDLAEIEAGTLVALNGEYMRVDTIAPGASYTTGDYWAPPVSPTGDLATLTVGRACLDTVPEEHFSGDKLIFFYDRGATVEDRYTDGEVVDVKLQNVTSRGIQDLAACLVDEVEFDARAWRPYPPGKVQVDGQYSAGDIWEAGARTFTWAHRDRLTQTTTSFDDHTVGNIGPEAGVTYSLRVVSVDAVGAEIATHFEASGLTGTSITIDADSDFSEPVSASAAAVWFEIWSERSEGSI